MVVGLLIGAAAASRPALAASRPALMRLRGGADEQPKTGKVWVTSTFTRDHTRFAAELGHYLGAYVGPRALPATTVESVMVTMNTINTCPYCTGLHGQLARMAGTKIDTSTPEVVYSTTFALESGRGAKVRAAYDTLASKIGAGKALSVRALCWALLWGKTTGNTINAVRDKFASLRLWKISPFELLMFLYYGPLFLVIALLNASLTLMPEVPAWCSVLLGVTLWVPQAVWIGTAGIISLVLRLLAAPITGLSL